MASKHIGVSALPKAAISSPVVQIQQQKPRSPPPSPPPSITLKDLQEALAKSSLQTVKQTEELLDKKNQELCENISHIFQGLAVHIDRIEGRVDDLVEKMEGTEDRLEKVEEGVEILQNDMVMSQYKEMEFALRIRGLKEDPQEKLKEEIVSALALALECNPEMIYGEIEKILRVNSWVARQRNIPRDVVVYFTTRVRRNEIIQLFYQQKFQIAAQDIILLKEIPSKILRGRKDFNFLAQELKKRQMPFRWEIPVGIVVNYAGTRYKLNSVQKAKDFYLSVLKADLPPSSASKAQEDLMEQLVVELPGAMSLSVGDSQNQQKMGVNPKEQRMTRVAYRRKEREQQQKETVSITYSSTLEPVGGARPKRSVTIDLQGMLNKLHKPKDAYVDNVECEWFDSAMEKELF